MKIYSYDYEWDKEYCYPNSSVLINKLNIRNQDDLSVAEREITSVKLAYAKQNPIPGHFNLEHLKSIHKFLFSDIYHWAGELRHVNISKGNQFCLSQNLEAYANGIFSQLREENFLVGCTDIAPRLSYYLSEINVLHPFREGNGRAQRLFIEYLAENAGYHVNFSDVSSKEMIIASADSFALNYQKMDALFKRITTENKSH